MKALVLFSILINVVLAGMISTKPFEKLSMFKMQGVKLVRAYDHGSIYEVEFIAPSREGLSRYTAYVTKDKKAFVLGSAFDMHNQKPLKMQLENINALKKNADIKVGTGKNELIVITDPECHYCHVFEKRWKALHKDYTLYVYLYPLSQHEEAAAMSYYVMSQKTQAAKENALLAVGEGKQSYKMFKPTEKQQKTFNKKFMNTQKLALRLGVRGTPSVYDLQGTFVNWSALQ